MSRYKLPTIKEKITFNDVYGDKQKYMSATAGYSFDFEQTNNFVPNFGYSLKKRREY